MSAELDVDYGALDAASSSLRGTARKRPSAGLDDASGCGSATVARQVHDFFQVLSAGCRGVNAGLTDTATAASATVRELQRTDLSLGRAASARF